MKHSKINKSYFLFMNTFKHESWSMGEVLTSISSMLLCIVNCYIHES